MNEGAVRNKARAPRSSRVEPDPKEPSFVKTARHSALPRELVAGRHKALVFSQFTDFLKLLAERLIRAGISDLYLDGRTPAAKRGKRVVGFQRGEGDLRVNINKICDRDL